MFARNKQTRALMSSNYPLYCGGDVYRGGNVLECKTMLIVLCVC